MGIKNNIKLDEKYELFKGVYANKEQQKAIDKISEFLDSKCEDKFFVLSGKGGTGKTTVISKVINDFLSNNKKVTILGAAPSHAAKKVLGQSLKFKVTLYTLASLLGMKLNYSSGNFEIDEYSRRQFGIPIETADIVIIDECSMVDEKLLSYIKSFKNGNSKIIFLGDHHQLPPIRDSFDMFTDKNSPTFDITKGALLEERMRQGENSPIVPITDLYADNIDHNTAINPLTDNERVTKYDRDLDEGVIFTRNVEQALFNMSLDFEKGIDDPSYVKGLAYTNVVRESVNTRIRELLWKDQSVNQFVIGEQVTAFDTYSNEFGKVILHNSDSFTIKKIKEGFHRKGYKLLLLTLKNEFVEVEVPVIERESKQEFELKVQSLFKIGKSKQAFDLRDSVANIQYGYAVTTHKSQGSTFRNIYVFENDIMNLTATSTKTKNQSMYVAVSRPTHKLVVVSY